MSGPASAPLRWRARTFGLLGAAGAVVALGVALRDPVALYFALPLLLAPVASALAAPRRAPTAALGWTESGSAGVVTVEGSVAPMAGPAEDLAVELTRPAGLVEAAPPETRWEPDRVEFRRQWLARAPTISTIEPPRVLWRDAAGLVERDVALSGSPLVVVRYPPELVRLRSVRLDRTTVLPGETRSRRLGSTGEFFGLREAEPGEPMRRINWRASARTGRLLANDYALERTGDLLLLLDARPTILGAEVDEALFSISRAAAAGIAEAFLSAKARVGLGIYGEFLDVVPLSTGRTQRARLQAALARARIATEPGPTERCVLAMRRFFPRGITTFLVSSLSDESGFELVPHLRHRGYPTVVLSPSPLPLMQGGVPLPEADAALAERLLRLDRRSGVRRAWRDAPTVDWESFDSLATFVDFLRRPAPRRFG